MHEWMAWSMLTLAFVVLALCAVAAPLRDIVADDDQQVVR